MLEYSSTKRKWGLRSIMAKSEIQVCNVNLHVSSLLTKYALSLIDINIKVHANSHFKLVRSFLQL